MFNDPISDMLTRIRNAYMARLDTVEIPASKLKVALALLLSSLGYVGKVGEVVNRRFAVGLKYSAGEPAVTSIKRISKPGLRRYAGVKEIAKLRQGLGFLILSTPKGLKTHVEARKEGVGGELICKVW